MGPSPAAAGRGAPRRRRGGGGGGPALVVRGECPPDLRRCARPTCVRVGVRGGGAPWRLPRSHGGGQPTPWLSGRDGAEGPRPQDAVCTNTRTPSSGPFHTSPRGGCWLRTVARVDGTPPPFPPLRAHSRPLPQGLEWLVSTRCKTGGLSNNRIPPRPQMRCCSGPPGTPPPFRSPPETRW